MSDSDIRRALAKSIGKSQLVKRSIEDELIPRLLPGMPALFGDSPVTMQAIGTHDGERFAMATYEDGTVILGEVGDFTPVEEESWSQHFDPSKPLVHALQYSWAMDYARRNAIPIGNVAMAAHHLIGLHDKTILVVDNGNPDFLFEARARGFTIEYVSTRP